MRRLRTFTVTSLALWGLGGAPGAADSPETLATQVRAREVAFAKTMADRDHGAFATFVSEEALFLGATVLRGREFRGHYTKPSPRVDRYVWCPRN